MNKHTATIDGQTFKRNSKTRRYTHAIVARRWAKIDVDCVYEKPTPYMRRGPGHSFVVKSLDETAGKLNWFVIGWAGSTKLAEARVNTEKRYPYADVIAIPAEVAEPVAA